MPLPAFVAPLLTATGIGAGIWGQERSRSQSKRNIQSQKEINQMNINYAQQRAKQEREWALMDWEKTNAYNSPEQQMQRFKEAGLNPHLIYGQGTQTGQPHQTQGAQPDLEAPRESVDYSIFPQAVSNAATGYVDMIKKVAETSNLEALNDSIRSQAELNRVRALVESENLIDKTRKNKIGDLITDALVTREDLKNELITAQTAKTKTETQILVPEFRIKQAELAIKKDQYRLQRAKTYKELENITSQILFRAVQGEKAREEINKILNAIERNDLEMQLKNLKLIPGTPEYNNRYINELGGILRFLPTNKPTQGTGKFNPYPRKTGRYMGPNKY